MSRLWPGVNRKIYPGYSKGNSGGGGGLPAWTKLPYWAFDNIKVPLLVGQEVTIYGDTLINVPIANDLTVEYTCAIGTQSGTKNFVISPIEANIGEHQLTCIFKNKGKSFLTKNITLQVSQASTIPALKVLLVGDSLTNSGNSYYAAQIRALMPSTTFTFLGTRGTTVKHEGYGGYTFGTFVNGGGQYGDPFFIAGQLNVPAYFTNNSVDTPDIVRIALGVNDVFSSAYSTGDGLTDAEIVTILNRAKTLVNAFLAFDPNLKILLGIPTIMDSTGAAWPGMYGTTYSPNLYINNIHKYWVAFVSTFANGVYDSRVECSYEPLILDRDNGYPKDGNGVHTNDVHPNAVGYGQLGRGIALHLNKLVQKPKLSVVWEDDYAAMSWSNNSGASAVFEIYESKNGGAYTLVTTTAAGATSYNNYTDMNAAMKFRVRAKVGNWYSDFSNEMTLNTPIVLKVDQTVLKDVKFSSFRVAAGKTVNINWDDNTNNDYTGLNVITKTYTVPKAAYYVKMTGDLNFIMDFIILDTTAQTHIGGNLTKLNLPTLLTYLTISKTFVNATITNWAWSTGLVALKLLTESGAGDNGFDGDLTGKQFPANCTNINISTSSTKRVVGDLSGTTFPVGITRFHSTSSKLTGLPRGNYKDFDSTIGLYALANNLSTTEIDSLLIDINNYYASVTPIKNQLYQLNGTGNGIPSATGLTARQGIIDKFTAAGFTATITVNS